MSPRSDPAVISLCYTTEGKGLVLIHVAWHKLLALSPVQSRLVAGQALVCADRKTLRMSVHTPWI